MLIYFPNCRILPVILLILISPFQGFAQDSFEKLKEKFQDGQVLEAQMSHTFVDAYTGDIIESSGNIWIGENQYKIEVDDQVVVVDGDISRVYNKRQNKVIISEYIPEDDDFAPSRFLAGDDHTYEIQETDSEIAATQLTLSSTDPFDVFSSVEIHLTQNLIPVKITAIDQTDNRFTTAFYEARFIAPTDSTFSFPHPDDADLIDLRQ
ncbi:MAG: outer-membrane lipoprotein carrier protein LolA [Balneolales bacterium]